MSRAPLAIRRDVRARREQRGRRRRERAARTASFTRTGLLLVPGPPLFRPPLKLAERPELAEAFERGRQARGARGALAVDELDRLFAAPTAVQDAYRLGLRASAPLRAPAPLRVALPATAVAVAGDALGAAPGPLRRRVPRIVAGISVAFVSAWVVDRAERRRARDLGLSRASAPRPPAFAELVAPLLVAFAQRVWLRGRTGRWPRTGWSSRAAMLVIREVRRRRDWNAAYGAGARTP